MSVIALNLTLCLACGLPPSPERFAPRNLDRIEFPGGYYWKWSSQPFDPSDRPPLVVCLHGTDTDAAEYLRFWTFLNRSLPMLFVAPQAMDTGWREEDLPRLERFWEAVSSGESFDPQRVLLVGHSAGGAMAFHLIFVESFPATAVATTANYVPPTLDAWHVKNRAAIPIFYAVGENDINRPRMRDGLALLRENGAGVTVCRPEIGHTLDAGTSQKAMDWFEDVCRKRVAEVIAQAAGEQNGLSPGQRAALLESVTEQAAFHLPAQVTVAEEALETLTSKDRVKLMQARRLSEEGRHGEAYRSAVDIESRFAGSRLGEDAGKLRSQLERSPQIVAWLKEQRNAAIEAEARNLLSQAYKSLAAGDLGTALGTSQDIVRLYPQSKSAGNAKIIIDKIKERVNPNVAEP